jgi:hypothetical protein
MRTFPRRQPTGVDADKTGMLHSERQGKKIRVSYRRDGRAYERKGGGERADTGTGPRLAMINSRRISVVLRAYNADPALRIPGLHPASPIQLTLPGRALERDAETPEATDAHLG